MSTKQTYTLLFRGEHVSTFTSTYDVQAVRLGYQRSPAPGQHPTLEVPRGQVGRVPQLLHRTKTVAGLKRTTDGPQWSTYPGQTFMIEVKPGTTEITDTQIVF